MLLTSLDGGHFGAGKYRFGNSTLNKRTGGKRDETTLANIVGGDIRVGKTCIISRSCFTRMASMRDQCQLPNAQFDREIIPHLPAFCRQAFSAPKIASPCFRRRILAKSGSE